ncbi:hypothetical protein GWP85_11345 [Acinetobacter beijerinckii]|uniref:hypothetical protein n=1 Tax=Acinetobacter beijerinckii TaxID=262668 RepID=UPI0023DD8136|nr:hypothetical protein [Acinetobacter beijerinckii]MDF2418097.1 hypothetical protein [Acinetobacter beijerinckii]
MKKIIFTLILIFISFKNYAAECTNLTTTYNLEKKYVLNNIRVYYSLIGVDKVNDTTDTNNNNIPDYIENAALQASTMYKAAVELGLRGPLESPRYLETNTQYIDFIAQGAGTGSSADEAYILTGILAGADGICSIRSNINPNLVGLTTRQDTLTVAHEVAHHFYNGYSMYQQNWFEGNHINGSWITESFSEWLEMILRNGELRTNGTEKLPATIDEIKLNIFTTPYVYDAGKVLDRIIKLADKGNGTVIFSNNLLQKKYLDGKNIIQDQRLRGVNIVKQILQRIDADDNSFASKFNLNSYKWPERYQRGCEATPARYCSDEINKRVLNIYRDLLLEIPNSNLTSEEKLEINNFINAVNSYQYWKK